MTHYTFGAPPPSMTGTAGWGDCSSFCSSITSASLADRRSRSRPGSKPAPALLRRAPRRFNVRRLVHLGGSLRRGLAASALHARERMLALTEVQHDLKAVVQGHLRTANAVSSSTSRWRVPPSRCVRRPNTSESNARSEEACRLLGGPWRAGALRRPDLRPSLPRAAGPAGDSGVTDSGGDRPTSPALCRPVPDPLGRMTASITQSRRSRRTS